MIDWLGFLSAAFSFLVLVWKEYQARASTQAVAQKQYELTTAEFQAIVNTVLTRERLRLAQESQAAQGAEKTLDEALAEREKKP